MRTGTVLGLLAGLVFCCHVQAKSIGPEVNEYVELMSVLARLADYPEYCMDLGGAAIRKMSTDILGNMKITRP